MKGVSKWTGCQHSEYGDNRKEGESQRSEEKIWPNRRKRQEKKPQQINKEEWRSCVFIVQAVNRVLIDPQTEAIIPVHRAQQRLQAREGKIDGGIGREDGAERENIGNNTAARK